MRKLFEKCQLNSLSDSDNAEHTDGKRSLYVPVKGVERAFSVKGQIHKRTRSRLSDEMLYYMYEKLLFLKINSKFVEC